MASASDSALSRISYIHDVSFASLAKLDHFIYKQNGYTAVNLGLDSANAQAARVNQFNCRLGKWLDGEESQNDFGHLHAYKAVDAPHHRVHESMQQALDALTGDWEQSPQVQQQLFESFSDVEQASDNVIENLDKMVVEKHGAHRG
ncbi:CZB domain-containing protein [Oceanospirillum beijerinckii]|uniref:CZB domain-containing protein n=1 Tax=Oceanospirillum beijerinckii TaxID=64976 RepID=UPI00040FC4C9|nr:CZB domain-containing protein [Oceanospirillum beijerinckii]